MSNHHSQSTRAVRRSAGFHLHNQAPGMERLTSRMTPHLSSAERIACKLMHAERREHTTAPPKPGLALRRFSWEGGQ